MDLEVSKLFLGYRTLDNFLELFNIYELMYTELFLLVKEFERGRGAACSKRALLKISVFPLSLAELFKTFIENSRTLCSVPELSKFL